MPKGQLIKCLMDYLGRDQWAKPKWLEGKERAEQEQRNKSRTKGEKLWSAARKRKG